MIGGFIVGMLTVLVIVGAFVAGIFVGKKYFSSKK